MWLSVRICLCCHEDTFETKTVRKAELTSKPSTYSSSPPFSHPFMLVHPMSINQFLTTCRKLSFNTVTFLNWWNFLFRLLYNKVTWKKLQELSKLSLSLGLRTGCFCHAGQAYLSYTVATLHQTKGWKKTFLEIQWSFISNQEDQLFFAMQVRLTSHTM